MSNTKVMRTTTLRINKPVHFHILERYFRPVFYKLPLSWVKAPSRSHKYAKLHIQLQNQLDHPYKVYNFAKIDDELVPVVYVLYRRNSEEIGADTPKTLTWSRQEMAPVDINFNDIPFHILIKLMQADYFRGNRPGTFVSQGEFFIIAKHGRDGDSAICVLIDVKGDRHNSEKMATQLFQVTDSIRKFIKVKNPKDPESIPQDSGKTTPYFRRELREAESVFKQIKEKELREFIEAGKPLYRIFRKSDRRPTLPYHDLNNLHACRGGILYSFIQNFCEYLASKGIEAVPTFRDLSKFSTYPEYANLPISRLGTIHLFDNRIERDQASLDGFLELFATVLNECKYILNFEIVPELPANSLIPTLLLQDHEAKDFVEGGVYFEQGINDPKQAIYGDLLFKNMPKQSLNIHTDIDRKDLGLRIRVALDQLFLKDIIINSRTIDGRLPGFVTSGNQPTQLPLFPHLDPSPLREYVFIRRKTYGGISRLTVASFNNNQIEFVDATDQQDALFEICENLSLDWNDIYYKLHEIDFRVKNGVIDEKKESKRFDLILRKEQAILIEDIHETVLYEYSEIDARQKALQQSLKIDSFRLKDHILPKNEGDHERFLLFDALLDELSEELPYGQISYRELIDGEWGKKIGEIFALKKNEKGRFMFGNFKKFYKPPYQNMFPSDKATELQTYQGIWYDRDYRYMVGEPDGIKRVQASANLVRQFTVLTGPGNIDIGALLSTTGIKFIRPKRYTVYPYFFNLIDMFVDISS